MARIYWILLIASLSVWSLGLLLDFGGWMIHGLLAIAALIVIYNLTLSRPRA